MALTDHLKAWPQYALPGHLLSRGVHALTRVRHPPFRNKLIDAFIRHFPVHMEEAEQPDPHAYEHFNAFFTRALKPGLRPLAGGEGEPVCPVDGTVSQVGPITGGRVFQAKGHDFSVEELLGGSDWAEPFRGGDFATLYLAPYNYHRVHMPVDGTLTRMVHIPGRLFSVSPATARAVPRLFARNERVACLFDTAVGPMALVLVGAVFVGSIETVWAGEVTPPAGGWTRLWRYDAPPLSLARGAEMGRFNMGSTVVVLFGKGAVQWSGELTPGQPVVMGQRLAVRRPK